MRYLAILISVLLTPFFMLGQVLAQDAVIVDSAPVQNIYQQPPVVPSTRKEAYEAKQREKQLKAERDAEAAKERLRLQAEKEAETPKETVVIRRYDPYVRDAITGKVISQGNAKDGEKVKVERYDSKVRDAITGEVIETDKAAKKR